MDVVALDWDCYAASARVAARRLTAVYDEALQEAGIGLTQFSLIRRIAQLGSATLTELSHSVELDRSTTGRNVRVVERLGLVQRKIGDDHRERLLELSPLGRQTLETALPLWQGAQARIEAELGLEDARDLRRMLNAV
jgi:DNA-binding MarR family transcriptional regulator